MHALHMKEVDATQVGGDCSHPDKRFFLVCHVPQSSMYGLAQSSFGN